MDNTYVFLDMGYLSKISKHLGNGNYLRYDIKQFANTLAKQKELWCKKAFVYTAPPYQNPTYPTTNDIEKREKHDSWVKTISKIPDLIVREGRCQKDDDGSFHQKGVDGHLIMDLFSLDENQDNIKTIILLACDTDFVTVLDVVRRKYKINVIIAFYSDFIRNSKFSMSNHLWNACDDKLLIDKSFFDKSARP